MPHQSTVESPPPKRSMWSRPWLRWIPPLLGVLLIAFFLHLGRWQLNRADEKRAILAAAEAAPTLHWGDWQEAPARYAQVSLSGQFDSQRHVLLDNQVLNGRPGVHVFTPFKLSPAECPGRPCWVLVNRGWLALSADRQLPDIPTPGEVIHIRAQVNQPPQVGLRLGQQQALDSRHWPQLMTYLDPPLVAAAMNLSLPGWILQLNADSPGGFDGRDWPVVNFGPEKHLSYAYTWFSLAFTVALVTGLLQWRGWQQGRVGKYSPIDPAKRASP